jgi:ABC-2 type transport system ATP-binding protein
VRITDLTIRYGEVVAVDRVTLVVAPGQVMGLLGGNGAGKSSTLRAVAGVNPPTSGEVVVAGFNLADPRQVEKARQAVGYCPDLGGLIPAATPREHIAATLAFRGLTHLWPQAYELLDRFELAGALDRLTGGFSHGMARRLSVVLAALTAEQVLILDEPFDGVDPQGSDATRGYRGGPGRRSGGHHLLTPAGPGRRVLRLRRGHVDRQARRLRSR